MKVYHLEDSMVMYSIYNAGTLEKLITTVHQVHNSTTPNERLPVNLALGLIGISAEMEFIIMP